MNREYEEMKLLLSEGAKHDHKGTFILYRGEKWNVIYYEGSPVFSKRVKKYGR